VGSGYSEARGDLDSASAMESSFIELWKQGKAHKPLTAASFSVITYNLTGCEPKCFAFKGILPQALVLCFLG